MQYSPLEQFDAILLLNLNLLGFDLTFTNIMLPLILCLILFYFVLKFYYFNFKLIPDFWQYLLESFFTFIINLIFEQTGKKGLIYFPFIFALFIFILLCNLISLTPFGFALTSHIIMIMFLALGLGISTFLLGLYLHKIHFLLLFVPDCPKAMLPLMIVIEIFSYIIRSFSLAIRLSANIMAGHTLVFIISGAILNAIYIKFWFFFLLVIFLLAILLLELGIAFLQAYVFTILICIYLADSLNKPGH